MDTSTRFPSSPAALRTRWPSVLPVGVATLCSLLYLVWDPVSTDLSSQRFRGWLFGQAPFAPWNNRWYAGHHTIGYSLLAPPAEWALGAPLAGAVSVVMGTWCGAVWLRRLVERTALEPRADAAGVLLAVGMTVSLVGGRTAFLTGSALLLATMLATTSSRRWPVLLLAALCAAASPVAGLFLALFGGAAWCARSLPPHRSVPLVVVPVAVLVPLLVLFPEGGDFPFPWGGVVNSLVVAGFAVWAGWRFVVLRWAGAAYAVLCLASALLPLPVGGNAARLAAVAVPVVLVLVVRAADTVGRAVLAALLAAVLVVQWSPVSLAVTGDRAPTEGAYYRPLLDLLADRRDEFGVERVEVVPVASHTESDVVAREFMLARGWNRQLDRRFHSLFYADRLSAEDYLTWLTENGVTVVAVAATDPDEGGRLETELLRTPPPYLRPLLDDGVWRVFEVVPAPSLIEGPAHLTGVTVDRFDVEVGGTGPVVVRVHFSPWFRVAGGTGCVREAPGGWTEVVAEPGSVRVEAGWSVAAWFDRDGDC